MLLQLRLKSTKFMDLMGTLPLFLCFAFLCAQVRKLNGDSIPGCIPIERHALLGFKKGLKDPTNRLLSWVGDDCCTWEGVACDNRSGHVVKLDLRNPFVNRSLGGELRPSLLGLKHLNYLDLSMNYFGGIPIPEFIGSFRQLKYLNLSKAGLGGLIPPQLGNLSSLQYLDLCSDLHLSGFLIDNAFWISHLSSLRYLNMIGVKFRGVRWLQALNMLPSIVEVHLASCDINTIPLSLPHVNFTSLYVLDLSFNFINWMPDWLFNISRLEYLNLRGNNLWGTISPTIKNLASLNFLDLSGNPFRGGKIPVAGLCKLQYLGLSTINISRNLHELDEVFTGCIKNSLETLVMVDTQLSGYLPDWFGDFSMLKSLNLSYNSISGPLPVSLERLSALQELDLHCNTLNGTVPGSLGRLAELVYLDLSWNQLEGVMSEEHFANLTKLNHLDLSNNQLILNLGPDWVPPFQLRWLSIGSCVLGRQFPPWLRMQENISHVDMSRTGISDIVPDWFWRSFSQIHHLNISGNAITGGLPDLTDFINLGYFDVSNNYFQGPLPKFSSSAMVVVDLSDNSFSGVIYPDIGKSMPHLEYLFLYKNNLSGGIPFSLCQLGFKVLDLSENHLVGELPDCWNQSSPIIFMDFSSNSLSGSVPLSIGSLPYLESLHLSNNNLTGEFPSSLEDCTNLVTLDLGQNGFTGTLPTWIGESLWHLKILSLRSNKLVGNIPPNLSRLSFLQILDLAHNNLSGTIPSSFGEFTSMKVFQDIDVTILNAFTNGYNDKIQLTMKGLDIEYVTVLSFVIVMDLSDNNLSGTIPEELTNLFGLVSLNLSRNHLSGEITEKIDGLKNLESLDLSSNGLSGGIPSSMDALFFLVYLNLSYNNLSGRIPFGNQLLTFDPSIYTGNPGLCGFPLTQECKVDEQNDNAEEGYDMKWLNMCTGAGFAAGFWVVFGPLLFNKKWREAYFRLIDLVCDMVYVAMTLIFSWFKEHIIATCC